MSGSGSGSGGISSSFTSSAGVTSSTVEDDRENNDDQGSSDYDSVSKDDVRRGFSTSISRRLITVVAELQAVEERPSA